jgi:hypothetical protein
MCDNALMPYWFKDKCIKVHTFVNNYLGNMLPSTYMEKVICYECNGYGIVLRAVW